MTNDLNQAEKRLGTLRTGLLIVAVCLAAGFAVNRFRQASSEAPILQAARPAMGTLVEISVSRVRTDADREASLEGVRAALAEVARVDSLFSRHLPAPRQMSQGERAKERRELLVLGLRILRMSGGAFDPRVAHLMSLWGFDGSKPSLPPPGALTLAVVRLADLGRPATAAELGSDPDLLHFGAWAKGYAVDRALDVLKAHGVKAALVDAGGDARGFGRDWRLGVQHPRLPGALVAVLKPRGMAVATSGDYEQYFEQDGVRYHHLLDPRTGEPARGCQSVTVLAATCALADVLSTAVFVMGPDAGMELVERLENVECLIIDADGMRHDSSGLKKYIFID